MSSDGICQVLAIASSLEGIVSIAQLMSLPKPQQEEWISQVN